MNPFECNKCINDVKTSVHGNDPRTWIQSCAQSTILKGGGKHEFKKCLIGKIESTQQHIEDPAGYADQLWNEIKGACS